MLNFCTVDFIFKCTVQTFKFTVEQIKFMVKRFKFTVEKFKCSFETYLFLVERLISRLRNSYTAHY